MEYRNRPARWLTNCSPLVYCQDHGKEFVCDTVSDDTTGIRRLWALLRGLWRNEVAVIHQSGKDILFLVIFNKLFFGGTRSIVGIDFQFSRPRSGIKARIKACLWKWVWSNVSLVLAHMRFIDELDRFYGIKEERFRFIPFKINGYENGSKTSVSDHGYVFTGGYSWRDYRTFCAAMLMLPHIPAKLVTLNPEALKIHGPNDTEILAPQNVEVIRHDENPDTWHKFLGQSRCVVIPVSEESICSNGISVCLHAMGLRKPVVISRSPAVDGIFESGEECLIVDFKDPEGMASAIQKLWEDSNFRKNLADRGYSAAKEFGGVDALMERIASAVLEVRADSANAD